MSLAVDNPVKISSVTHAREKFSNFIDAAEAGEVRPFARRDSVLTLIDADKLAHYLRALRQVDAQVVRENGVYNIFVPGLPIAGEGISLDEALDEVVDALREYAAAWVKRLKFAPNHKDNWDLAQIIQLSSDEELKVWLAGE